MFTFHTKLKGTTHRDGVTTVLKSLQPKQVLSLVREPTNQFDPNAIKVYLGDIHLGYIPKETAPKIKDDVEKGNVVCRVSEVTGGTVGKENVGCNLIIEVNRDDNKN